MLHTNCVAQNADCYIVTRAPVLLFTKNAETCDHLRTMLRRQKEPWTRFQLSWRCWWRYPGFQCDSGSNSCYFDPQKNNIPRDAIPRSAMVQSRNM